MAAAQQIVADLRAESDELDALVADACRRCAGPTPTPGRGLDHRPSDRAPAVDRPRRADRGHRRAGLRRSCWDRGGRPDGLRRRGRRGARRYGARRAARRLAADPRAAARRAADRRRRPQAAVVRAADERRVDGDRAADGDLGARPRRRRRPGCDAARRPPGCARSPISACAPATSRSPSTGCPPPAEPFLVELRAPDGSTWSWGPPDAAQRVTGRAEDFCMLVTQRRPLRDLDVTAEGDDAQRWLPIAQAFAGPPGVGR